MEIFDAFIKILAWLYLYLLFNVFMSALIYSQVAGPILDDEWNDPDGKRWRSPYYYHNWQAKMALDPAQVVRGPPDFFLLRTHGVPISRGTEDDRSRSEDLDIPTPTKDVPSPHITNTSEESDKQARWLLAQTFKGPPALLYEKPASQAPRPYTEPPILSYSTFEEDGAMYDRLEDIRKSNWSIERKTVISDREIEDKVLDMYLEYMFEETCEAYEAVDTERARFNAALMEDLLVEVQECYQEHREAIKRFANEEVEKARSSLLSMQIELSRTLVACAQNMEMRLDGSDQDADRLISTILSDWASIVRKPEESKLRNNLRVYSILLETVELLEEGNSLEEEAIEKRSRLTYLRTAEVRESLRLLRGGAVEFPEHKGRREDDTGFGFWVMNVIWELVTPLLD